MGIVSDPGGGGKGFVTTVQEGVPAGPRGCRSPIVSRSRLDELKARLRADGAEGRGQQVGGGGHVLE